MEERKLDMGIFMSSAREVAIQSALLEGYKEWIESFKVSDFKIVGSAGLGLSLELDDLDMDMVFRTFDFDGVLPDEQFYDTIKKYNYGYGYCKPEDGNCHSYPIIQSLASELHTKWKRGCERFIKILETNLPEAKKALLDYRKELEDAGKWEEPKAYQERINKVRRENAERDRTERLKQLEAGGGEDNPALQQPVSKLQYKSTRPSE